MKQMYNVEQQIIQLNDFSTYCKAKSTTDTSCADDSYNSFAKYFESQILADTLTQTDIDNFLSTLASDNTLFNQYYIFLDTGFTQTNLVSSKARAIYLFGQPIEKGGKRYSSYLDDPESQGEYFAEFTFVMEKSVKNYQSDLKVQLYSEVWYEEKIDELIDQDFLLAGASFVFVTIYISIHIGSGFLGGTAMLAVGISYPVTLFIIRFIFQITFFMSLNF